MPRVAWVCLLPRLGVVAHVDAAGVLGDVVVKEARPPMVHRALDLLLVLVPDELNIEGEEGEGG